MEDGNNVRHKMLRAKFQEADKDGSGFLEKAEVIKLLTALGKVVFSVLYSIANPEKTHKNKSSQNLLRVFYAQAFDHEHTNQEKENQQ